ncbi:hypothetical protein BDN72DRAFT_831517 [Pluteus cervinus]|uniref:Uncharacterized protein n=1 Tax=Pluteus cervinus TaxID=181527 RepID=A0ACD3BDH8_9AGAR|nr:hypothetical protein BDN72DRAFT_831517 [Pluteus cervinus]
MSSISFPSGHLPSEASSSTENSFYNAPPFDGSASFQMNPLSSHPPRTPRTSVIATNSHHYDSTTFEIKVDHTEERSDEGSEGASEREEDDPVVQAKANRIRREDVWKEMILTSNGRDKAFKLIQYALRVYLLFHNAVTFRRLKRTAFELDILKRIHSAVDGLSFSRKTLLLFNWLAPLTTVLAQQSVPFSSEHNKRASQKTVRPFLHALLYAPPPVLLELVNAIADDVATLAKLGLLSKKTGDRAGRFADWCWMLSTAVGLVENGLERQINTGLQTQLENRLYSESMTGVTEKSKSRSSKFDEKELEKLQRKDYWLQITRAKLVMDLIFVSYDIFRINRLREPIKAFTGLAAAILSSAKLYDRHKSMLLKSISLAA